MDLIICTGFNHSMDVFRGGSKGDRASVCHDKASFAASVELVQRFRLYRLRSPHLQRVNAVEVAEQADALFNAVIDFADIQGKILFAFFYQQSVNSHLTEIRQQRHDIAQEVAHRNQAHFPHFAVKFLLLVLLRFLLLEEFMTKLEIVYVILI